MSLKFRTRTRVEDAIVLDTSPGPGSYSGSRVVGPVGYWNRNSDGSYSQNPFYRPPTVPRGTRTSLPARTGPGYRVTPSARRVRPEPAPAGPQFDWNAATRFAERSLAEFFFPATHGLWPIVTGAGTKWTKGAGGPEFPTGDVIIYAPMTTPRGPNVTYHHGGFWGGPTSFQQYGLLQTKIVPDGVAWTGAVLSRSGTSNTVFHMEQRTDQFFDGSMKYYHLHSGSWRYPEMAGKSGTPALPVLVNNVRSLPAPRLPLGWFLPRLNRPGSVLRTVTVPRHLLRGRGRDRWDRDLHNPPYRPPGRPDLGGVTAVITVPPTGGPPSKTTFPPSPRRPPSKGTKEKKSAASTAAFRILRGALGTTEALDLLDAVWGALPIQYRVGRSPFEKMHDLVTHWDKLSATDVVLNIVKNQLEDAIIGRVNQLGSGAFKQLTGRPQSIWFQGG